MPAYTKTILCLSNSRRPGGTCVAGKELVDGVVGGWIRPINLQHHNAIGVNDLRLEGGGRADVFDVLTVPMLEARPNGHQTENHLIDTGSLWIKDGAASWEDIEAATDAGVGPLWLNGNSSYHGTNDNIPQTSLGGIASSLKLIRPSRLAIVVGRESQYGGGTKRKIRADFDLNGTRYNFVITDPWAETIYFAQNDGTYQIGESRLCVSLAEVGYGVATKLVATVITPNRIG